MTSASALENNIFYCLIHQTAQFPPVRLIECALSLIKIKENQNFLCQITIFLSLSLFCSYIFIHRFFHGNVGKYKKDDQAIQFLDFLEMRRRQKAKLHSDSGIQEENLYISNTTLFENAICIVNVLFSIVISIISCHFWIFQVKIWFQNHRYKCKRQAKEKAMAEQNQHNQV